MFSLAVNKMKQYDRMKNKLLWKWSRGRLERKYLWNKMWKARDLRQKKNHLQHARQFGDIEIGTRPVIRPTPLSF